jgi:hypothetical protein
LPRIDARCQHRAALLEIDAELFAARDQVTPVVYRAVEQSIDEAPDDRFAGALRRPRSLHLEREQRGHGPEDGRLGMVPTRAEAKLADAGLGYAQLDRRDPVASSQELALAGRRAGGDGEHGAASIDERNGGAQRSGGSTRCLGQAGA